MKKLIQKYSPAVLVLGALGVGIVSANIADIPSLSSVSSGDIINASDINDLVESVTVLDKRIFAEDNANNQFSFSKKSDGTDRTSSEKINILDSGEIQIDSSISLSTIDSYADNLIITKGWLDNEFTDFKVPSYATLEDVPTPLETGQVVLIGSVLNVYNGTVWIEVNPL